MPRLRIKICGKVLYSPPLNTPEIKFVKTLRDQDAHLQESVLRAARVRVVQATPVEYLLHLPRETCILQGHRPTTTHSQARPILTLLRSQSRAAPYNVRCLARTIHFPPTATLWQCCRLK